MTKPNHGEALGQAMAVNMAERREVSIDPFSHAPAHVGMEMSLEIRSVAHEQNKVMTQLVGFVRGSYIIVSAPRVGGNTLAIGNGRNQVVVRYILDGTVFGFQSTALRTIGAPFHLTFLKYPDKIEEVSLRRKPRVQVVIPVEREKETAGRELIMNLSGMGALLQLVEPVHLDDTIHITFGLPNGDKIENLACMVRRVEITRDRVLAGVQFEKEEEKLASIDNYLEMVIETLGSNEAAG